MDQREDYADLDLPPPVSRLTVAVRILNALAILTVVGVFMLLPTALLAFWFFFW